MRIRRMGRRRITSRPHRLTGSSYVTTTCLLITTKSEQTNKQMNIQQLFVSFYHTVSMHHSSSGCSQVASPETLL